LVVVVSTEMLDTPGLRLPEDGKDCDGRMTFAVDASASTEADRDFPPREPMLRLREAPCNRSSHLGPCRDRRRRQLMSAAF
jgi:hypothetical protein